MNKKIVFVGVFLIASFFISSKAFATSSILISPMTVNSCSEGTVSMSLNASVHSGNALVTVALVSPTGTIIGWTGDPAQSPYTLYNALGGAGTVFTLASSTNSFSCQAGGNYQLLAVDTYGTGPNANYIQGTLCPGGASSTGCYINLDNAGYLSSTSTAALTITGGSATPSIGFAWPPNNQQILDFTNWVLNVSTTANSTQGLVSVFYGTTSSTMNYVDTAQYNTFISSYPFLVKKSILLNPIINLYATSTWYAQACYGGTTFSSTCTSVISFTINPAALPSASTSSAAAVQIDNSPDFNFSSTTASSAVIANPYSCQGTFLGISISNCFNWALFAFAQVLFQPTQGSQVYLQNAVSSFEAVPPFTGVFSVLNFVQSSTQAVPTNIDAMENVNFGSTSGTIPFLTSSTASEALTPAGKTLLFSLEDIAFSIMDLMLIFFVPWHWWKKKHSAQMIK